jgi:hypothetical protein
MNRDQEAAQKSMQAVVILSEHFAVVERYDHPAIDLQLLQRQAGGAGQ